MSENDYNILVHNNQIWFEGEINFSTVHRLMFEITRQSGKVELFINSNGGYVDAGLGFYDFLNINHKKITVIAHSFIGSAACEWLFSKCRTYVFPSLEIMFHPMRQYLHERSEALEGILVASQTKIKLTNEIYASKGFSCDWENKTLFFYADEFVRRGIVDGFWTGSQT